MLSSKSILLKKIDYLNLNNIELTITYEYKKNNSYINYKHKNNLNNIKEYICNLKHWNIYRRLFNPLSLLNLLDEKKKNIGIYNNKILSRSFFKMIEIEKDYNIFYKYKNKNIKTTFIAEAPGGFIESFYKLRKDYKDTYYGISLIEKNKNIPNWNNLLNKKYERIKLLYGYDNTGNIYKLINILNYINNIGENTCDIVTADGGFDFTKDYDNQEYNFLKLFFCEIVLALKLQKLGGTFIIKCFDLTHIIGIKLFYILSHLYETITITKLKTSRQTNSERYIICKNLKVILNNDIIKRFYELILKWDYNVINFADLFNFDINKDFLKKLEEYNDWFYMKQIKVYNIIFSIDLNLNKSNIKMFIKQLIIKNIKKNISFCNYNNLEINNNSYILNTHINFIIKKYFDLY